MTDNTTLSASQYIELIESQQPKVLWSETYWAHYDSLFDVFYSFCEIGGRLISLHGEMNIETFHKRREANANIARLYKCEYSIGEDGRLTRTRKQYIGLGADPRMVSNGSQAYAYVTGYGEARHPAFLYVEKDNSLHPIRAQQGFDWGKNWQPFMQGERLFIVHELSPFSVYEIDLEDYQLHLIKQSCSDWGLSAHYTRHTMFRGGANAIQQGQWLLGVGRASAQPYKHTPFLWSSHSLSAPNLHFLNTFNSLSDKGFNIIDPTCLLVRDKQLLIGLACSETCWFHEQQFLNLLLAFDLTDDTTTLPSLDETLSQFPSIYRQGKPNLSRHLFHCDQMQHDIPFWHEYGVRSSGAAGILVYGPFIEVCEEAHLVIELFYLTEQPAGEQAGSFDVQLSRKGATDDVEFIQAQACTLTTTGNDIRKAILHLDTTDYLGYAAEFRVTVNQGIELNAFHVRTTEVADVIVCPDLPATIPVSNANGVRSSVGDAGFLFYGPYREIAQEGRYTARLHYLADAPEHQDIAKFDIAVTSETGETHVIAEHTVKGSNGIWHEADLMFDLNTYRQYKLETRLFTTESCQISASYIQIVSH